MGSLLYIDDGLYEQDTPLGRWLKSVVRRLIPCHYLSLHKRNGKVAKELTDKGYCATKKLHFYGVKVHTPGLRRPSTIPFPQYVDITAATCSRPECIKKYFRKNQSRRRYFRQSLCRYKSGKTDAAKGQHFADAHQR